MNSRDLKYYVKFKDADGHEHFAMHCYNRISGYVTSMRDLAFE